MKRTRNIRLWTGIVPTDGRNEIEKHKVQRREGAINWRQRFMEPAVCTTNPPGEG